MPNNKRSRKKIYIFSGIGAVLVVLVLLVILGTKKGKVIRVQTEKASLRTLTQTVTASGKIQPEVQVKISPEVSGEITALPVREGQEVKKGELLLKIKPDIYIARRDQMEAAMNSAKANRERSRSEYKRAEDLYAKGLISEADLEAARTLYHVNKAQYEQAQAALNQAIEDLNKTTVYSPMNGTVSQLKSELGERVLGTQQFQGTEVMTVADLSKMEARVDVDENDVVLVSLGDTARIEVDAYRDKKLTGVLSEIAKTATTKGLGTQQEITNFLVKIRILDKDLELLPGMSVTVDIETETRENVLSVPIQSVTTRLPKEEKKGGDEEEKEEAGQGEAIAQGRPNIRNKKENKPLEVVFVVQNGAAKMVPVKRGISDDDHVEILDGINEGDKIVSGSYRAINRDLEDGSKVRIEKGKTSSKRGARNEG
ncbi:MAG: efflux RND transporter periplasmic adaptor subunit [Bacteroidota bacterium]